MASHKQDPNSVLDWSMDWEDQLVGNGNATITAATVVCPNVAADITSVSHTGTVVTWRLTVTGITKGTLVHTVHVTLSTGEQDERDLTIQVVNT